MSKQILLLLSAILLTINCFGQGVAINTTGAAPNASALLDVDAPNKGVLMPRVKLTSITDVSTISFPAIGLMVYNTNANMTGGGIGFYYYTGARWVPFISCEGYDNLIISSTSSNVVNITADKLCIGNMQLTNVNVTANISTSGAGGLDVLPETANTWYYIHVITDSIGGNVDALLSTSATAPTLPATHNQFRRVGAVRNDASNAFLQFDQEGNAVKYHIKHNILANGTSTTYTDVSLTSVVPSTSQRANCEFILFASHPTSSLTALFRKKGASAHISALGIGSGSVQREYLYDDIPTDANQTIQYLVNITPAFQGVYISVTGYFDRF